MGIKTDLYKSVKPYFPSVKKTIIEPFADKLVEPIGYIVSNGTIVGQAVIGTWSLGEAGCAAMDSAATPSPPAKVLYAGAAVLQGVAGVCYLGAAGTSTVFPPVGLVLVGTGTCCRKWGKHTLIIAHTVNPVPSASKIKDIMKIPGG